MAETIAASNQAKKKSLSEVNGSRIHQRRTVAQGLQSPSGQKPTHSKTAVPSVIIANPTD